MGITLISFSMQKILGIEPQKPKPYVPDPLVLVTKGSRRQLVFKDINKLKSGEVGTGYLSSPAGSLGKVSGKMLTPDGEWNYMNVGRICWDDVIRFKYEDNNYLKLADDDMVLHVAFNELVEDKLVEFVGAVNPDKKVEKSGREWTLNNNGTISIKGKPNLVLGF